MRRQVHARLLRTPSCHALPHYEPSTLARLICIQPCPLPLPMSCMLRRMYQRLHQPIVGRRELPPLS